MTRPNPTTPEDTRIRIFLDLTRAAQRIDPSAWKDVRAASTAEKKRVRAAQDAYLAIPRIDRTDEQRAAYCRVVSDVAAERIVRESLAALEIIARWRP